MHRLNFLGYGDSCDGDKMDATMQLPAVKSRTQGKQFVIPDTTQIKGSGRDTWLDKSLPIGTIPVSPVWPIVIALKHYSNTDGAPGED